MMNDVVVGGTGRRGFREFLIACAKREMGASVNMGGRWHVQISTNCDKHFMRVGALSQVAFNFRSDYFRTLTFTKVKRGLLD